MVDHPARGQAVGGVVVATGASLGSGVCDGASVPTQDCRGVGSRVAGHRWCMAALSCSQWRPRVWA